MLYKGQLVKRMYSRPKKIAVVLESEDINGFVTIQRITSNYPLSHTVTPMLQPATMANLKRFIKTHYYSWHSVIPDSLKLMNIEQHLQVYVRPVYPGQPSTHKGGKKMK